MTEKRRSALARLSLVFAALIWGVSFVVMKDSVDIYSPAWLLAMRFLMGAFALALFYFPVFLKRRRGNSEIPPFSKHLAGGAVMGAFLFLAYYVQTWGLKFTTPGKNAFLTTVYCVLVPFLFMLVAKGKTDIYNYLAAVICFIGIGFVALDSGLSINIGDVLTIVGGLFYALHMLSVSMASKGRDVIVLTVVQFFVAAVLSAAVALFTETPPTVFTAKSISGLLFLGIFATGVAMLCQNVGQKYTPPTAASILLSLEAVFGVIFSLILGREKLSLQLSVGFLLIFVAVITSETKLSFINFKAIRNLFKKGH